LVGAALGAELGAGAVSCEKTRFAPASRQSIAAIQVVLTIFIIILSHARNIAFSQLRRHLAVITQLQRAGISAVEAYRAEKSQCKKNRMKTA
jgi:hypothetical protein